MQLNTDITIKKEINTYLNIFLFYYDEWNESKANSTIICIGGIPLPTRKRGSEGHTRLLSPFLYH